MKNPRQDWHPAEIVAALRKKGTSVSAVSRECGLSSSTLANALNRPWPKGEMILALAIGVDAAEIWPSRYYEKNGRLINREARIRSRKQPAGREPR